MECAIADSLEVFVAEDAFEGGAFMERTTFDNFELIGEGNTHEGVAFMECAIANSFEILVEDDALEGGAQGKHLLFDDFELIGESDTREGVAS